MSEPIVPWRTDRRCPNCTCCSILEERDVVQCFGCMLDDCGQKNCIGFEIPM